MVGKKIITEKMLESSDSFTAIVKPGDIVEKKIVDNFLGCVPPATHRSNLIQCGEPYSDAWDEQSQKHRAIYFTFSLNGSNWQYCGTCFLGETTHRNSRTIVALDSE